MPHGSHRSCRRSAFFMGSLLAGLVGTHTAHASSSDAWEEFRKDVQESCVAASQGAMNVTRVEVDPHGSESYGFAVLYGFQSGEPKQKMLVCAYSKRDQTAEISAPFEP